MVMYGIYNAETLEELINTLHHIHNTTTSNEKLFAGQDSTTILQCKGAGIDGISCMGCSVSLACRQLRFSLLSGQL